VLLPSATTGTPDCMHHLFLATVGVSALISFRGLPIERMVPAVARFVEAPPIPRLGSRIAGPNCRLALMGPSLLAAILIFPSLRPTG
jgi:hypothetical protein